MYDEKYLSEFYNNYDEDLRLAEKHGSVEFLTTIRYVDKYVKNGDRILEIGAGTGRYSHFLARKGYAVDAVELVEHNIEAFKKNTQENEKITIIKGNALDLNFIPDAKYDVTLLLGPMYHLYTKKDKLQALNEAIRVTKPNGIIYVAYVISDGCLLDEGFHRGNIDVEDYIKNGLIDGQTFAAKSEAKDVFDLVRKEDVDDLNSSLNVRRLHYVSSDGCALFMREALDNMTDEKFNLFLKYHFATCEREDLWGVTSHSLDILQKIK